MSKKKLDIVIRRYGNKDLSDIQNMNLEAYEIQIWTLYWRGLENWIQYYKKILSQEEWEYVSRFISHEDRMRSSVGKILVRKLLAQYMNISEETVVISKNRYGRPYVDSTIPIYFNISHSGEVVMVAVSKEMVVGIDVEKISKLKEYNSLAENFFTLNEWRSIASADSIELFYEYWTAKEAYVKAVGMGLSKALDSFEIIGKSEIIDFVQQVKWNRQKIDTLAGYMANIVYLPSERKK